MRTEFCFIFSCLCALQLVGIAGSTIAATVNIESIVVTGPILSLLGLVTAVGFLSSRSPANLLFGFSLPIFSLGVFALIYSKSWSPQQAATPVSSIILGYQSLAVPLGSFALYRTVQACYPAALSRRGVWQFNLRSLFYLTLVCSLSLGIGRMGLYLGGNLRAALAISTGLLTIMLIGIATWAGAKMHEPRLNT